ncbi:hypothetical protein R3J36_03260 [Xylella fastidiosa subsp. multiplex]|uniref:hypothetical protein n=3 Tax=Xylella fastidiosa TaxID=2371 RepID=UPI00215658F9|nr:hypothetical protein [Xylella fastidiosa]MCO5546511.1 hypothetical protein [Xylella fastidiosa]MDC7969718.1 hypothetical protein [Xylella fastidiosa subsp. multiplex]WDF06115.1 hypothetical protein PT012_06335 [Xylella fastidiosa subsp. multiplex]WDF06525.1 hypothetical protein PT012_08655 [Xylella fastidiosa subsp. multiplex]WDF07589.1 hypothetical protein PT012_03245 [Xylella fastidiosa subsp. multiplex]
MTDPRRLLARLNPSTIRYDTLPGGVPELTAQDIAHALGLVPAGLGREVLQACWWPDGAALRRGPLRDAAVALVVPEIRRQQQRLLEARTDVGIVKACMGWTRATTSAQQAALRRAEERLDKLKAHLWPQATLEMLPVLVAAVVDELSTPQLCPCCHGRGERRVGALVKVCTACGGSGAVPASDRKRAAAIGRDESTYRTTWRSLYEWLLERMGVAERQAATQLQEALQTDAA